MLETMLMRGIDKRQAARIFRELPRHSGDDVIASVMDFVHAHSFVRSSVEFAAEVAGDRLISREVLAQPSSNAPPRVPPRRERVLVDVRIERGRVVRKTKKRWGEK